MSKYSELADRLDAAREPVRAVVAWEAGSALRELEAENGRLQDELRLVTSPQESVGAVIVALKAERDRLRGIYDYVAVELHKAKEDRATLLHCLKVIVCHAEGREDLDAELHLDIARDIIERMEK